jgi:hypothetical protein
MIQSLLNSTTNTRLSFLTLEPFCVMLQIHYICAFCLLPCDDHCHLRILPARKEAISRCSSSTLDCNRDYRKEKLLVAVRLQCLPVYSAYWLNWHLFSLCLHASEYKVNSPYFSTGPGSLLPLISLWLSQKWDNRALTGWLFLFFWLVINLISFSWKPSSQYL